MPIGNIGQWATATVALVALIVSVFVALHVNAAKARAATGAAEQELARTRTDGAIAMLAAKLDTLRAEMLLAIANAGTEFYRNVNGQYVRSKVFEATVAGLQEQIANAKEAAEGS